MYRQGQPSLVFATTCWVGPLWLDEGRRADTGLTNCPASEVLLLFPSLFPGDSCRDSSPPCTRGAVRSNTQKILHPAISQNRRGGGETRFHGTPIWVQTGPSAPSRGAHLACQVCFFYSIWLACLLLLCLTAEFFSSSKTTTSRQLTPGPAYSKKIISKLDSHFWSVALNKIFYSWQKPA